MGCHGHCHFTKQIKKATENENNSSSVPKLRLELNYVSNESNDWLHLTSYIQNVSLNNLFEPQIRDFYPSIHKPPC